MSWGSLGEGLKVPLHNVLLQEVIRIQGIADLVKQSLVDIREALQGRLMMTEEIVKCINSLYDARPPHIWQFNANDEEISWLSPNAAIWFEGLNLRANRLREWLECPTGVRPVFWLPGFLNPQGFMAAFKQEVFKLKKNSSQGGGEATLDKVVLNYVPDTKNETDVKLYLADPRRKTENVKGSISIVIHGLFLEGANFNNYLQDDPNANSRTPIVRFPVLRIEGTLEENQKSASQNITPTYKCPLYKYPRRTDKYFIMEIGLKISGSSGGDQDEKFWQKRGVALLCNQE